MYQIRPLLHAAGCMSAARVPVVLSPTEPVSLYGLPCSRCSCGPSGHASTQQPGRPSVQDGGHVASNSQNQQSLLQTMPYRQKTLLTWLRCWCRPMRCWPGQTQHTQQSGMCKSRPRWTPPWGDSQLTGTPPWSAMCAQPPVCPRSKQQLTVSHQALQELHNFMVQHEQDISFIWLIWP